MMLRTRLIALFFLAWHPVPALACKAADDLADFHSGYAALLSGRPAEAVNTSPLNPLDLVRRLGQEGAPVDVSEMAKVAADLALLAETAQSGDVTEMSPANFARHVKNLEKIQDWITATGCETEITTLAPSASRQGIGPRDTSQTTTIPPRSAETTPSALPVVIILLTLVGGVCLAAYVFRREVYKTLRLRGRRQEKRVPVSIEALLILEGHETTIAARAVDLSRGGTKLATDTPLPEKTRLQIMLKDETHAATVAWSNNFYAGLSFSPPLSDEAFQKLKDS